MTVKVGDRLAWTKMTKPYVEGVVTEADDYCFTIEWDKDQTHSTFRQSDTTYLERKT